VPWRLSTHFFCAELKERWREHFGVCIHYPLPFYSLSPDDKKVLVERVSQRVSQSRAIVTNFIVQPGLALEGATDSRLPTGNFNSVGMYSARAMPS
jgi:hypothetical protein